jgi:hypothetical protein
MTPNTTTFKSGWYIRSDPNPLSPVKRAHYYLNPDRSICSNPMPFLHVETTPDESNVKLCPNCKTLFVFKSHTLKSYG